MRLILLRDTANRIETTVAVSDVKIEGMGNMARRLGRLIAAYDLTHSYRQGDIGVAVEAASNQFRLDQPRLSAVLEGLRGHQPYNELYTRVNLVLQGLASEPEIHLLTLLAMKEDLTRHPRVATVDLDLVLSRLRAERLNRGYVTQAADRKASSEYFAKHLLPLSEAIKLYGDNRTHSRTEVVLASARCTVCLDHFTWA